MVPSERLELSRLSSLPPQGSVSTNSTTTAKLYCHASLEYLELLMARLTQLVQYYQLIALPHF